MIRGFASGILVGGVVSALVLAAVSYVAPVEVTAPGVTAPTPLAEPSATPAAPAAPVATPVAPAAPAVPAAPVPDAPPGAVTPVAPAAPATAPPADGTTAPKTDLAPGTPQAPATGTVIPASEALTPPAKDVPASDKAATAPPVASTPPAEVATMPAAQVEAEKAEAPVAEAAPSPPLSDAGPLALTAAPPRTTPELAGDPAVAVDAPATVAELPPMVVADAPAALGPLDPLPGTDAVLPPMLAEAVPEASAPAVLARIAPETAPALPAPPSPAPDVIVGKPPAPAALPRAEPSPAVIAQGDPTPVLPGRQKPLPQLTPDARPPAVLPLPDLPPAAPKPRILTNDVAVEDANPATLAPAPRLGGKVDGVVSGRLPRIGEAAPAPASSADEPPLVRYARPFDNPDQKPVFSIILIDTGAAEIDRKALAELPFPVSFALDPMDPNASDHAAIYRAAGQEVLTLATGIPEGATASDLEVSFAALADRVPEAVAILDQPDPVFQDDRPLATQVVPILAAQGRGMVTWDEGLNAADQVARREGLPSVTAFRYLDGEGEGAETVRRYLDRAAFRAAQDGRVVVIGQTRPETVEALIAWGLEGRSASVALAPISAAMTVK